MSILFNKNDFTPYNMFMNYKNSIIEAIGNTPLVRLNKIERKYNLPFKLFAKVERFNPTAA